MKKKNIIFLLQNGIGFGHFKLALTIAHYFDVREYEIIFFTQAKSTRIFEGQPFRVFNIPPVYSLKANNEVLLIHTLADQLIQKLHPCLVIEDTYPDDFYLNLPSIIHVPKLLIVNRLMAVEFENYYYGGMLRQYSRLLLLKSKEEFLQGITAPEVRNHVAFSDQIICCGKIFNEPSDEICRKIREKYHFSQYGKTVVVNCGAGGWHIGENICRKIFEEITEAANHINSENAYTQFILLIGPYSSYLKEYLEPITGPNTKIHFVDFDDNADALFHEADLVILRPGYNSTMEALAGRGQVLLLPGISYLEEQTVWCEELKQRYGIDYVPVSRLENLEEHMRKLLSMPAVPPRSIKNHAKEAMAAIAQCITQSQTIPNVAFVLGISARDDWSDRIKALTSQLLDLGAASCSEASISDQECRIGIVNQGCSYQHFCGLEAVALYLDEGLCNREASFYQSRYHFEERGIIVLPITEVVVVDDLAHSITKFLHVLNNASLFSDCINLSIDSKPENETETVCFLEWLLCVLKHNLAVNISIRKWLCNTVNSRLGKFSFGRYRPEIVKLNW